MSLGHYLLSGRKIVNCEHMDMHQYALEYEAMRQHKHLGDTTVKGVRVSTVFLGFDHSFGSGPPVLFETMVFGGKLDQQIQRYYTYDEAERGHKRTVHRVRLAEQSELECAITKVRRKAKP